MKHLTVSVGSIAERNELSAELAALVGGGNDWCPQPYPAPPPPPPPPPPRGPIPWPSPVP